MLCICIRWRLISVTLFFVKKSSVFLVSIITTLVLTFSGSVAAVTLEISYSAPPLNTHFSLTISGSPYYIYSLKERFNGGVWTNHSGVEQSGGVYWFHYRPSGKYEFYLQYCLSPAETYVLEGECPNFSNIVAVEVNSSSDPTAINAAYEYKYDKAGRLITIYETSPGFRSSDPTLIYSATKKETLYEYDDADNRLTKVYENE